MHKFLTVCRGQNEWDITKVKVGCFACNTNLTYDSWNCAQYQKLFKSFAAFLKKQNTTQETEATTAEYNKSEQVFLLLYIQNSKTNFT